jgi:uncharacterized membrane protein YhiD involved in acid resistance
MADQASVSGSRNNGSGDSVVGSIAGFGNDVATLIELQLKLFQVDFKDLTVRAVVPVAVLGVGVVVLLGSVPVLIGGAGLLLASALGVSIGLGLLLAALAALVAAGVAMLFAVKALRRSLEALQRSREELQRNISWIRTVLVYSGRAVPRRRF